MTAVHARFADAEPELANGFAEHATMGAEAMLALGLDPAAVVAWAFRHQPVPLPALSPLRTERDRIAADLADRHWGEVLGDCAGSLVDRLDTHLFHGLIRTAHAARALRTLDGPEARAELALALAAWTLWAGAPRPDVTPLDAPSGATEPLTQVLEAARRGAAAYVTTPSIFTLHAITAPMAYLLIADHLDAHAHATAAGVFTRTHGDHPEPPSRPNERPAPGPDQLAALALRWDAHPAKLVEAALRGHNLTGDATFGDAVAAMMDHGF